jgi:3-oxoacyl-[acyl-carrier protein] reductase
LGLARDGASVVASDINLGLARPVAQEVAGVAMETDVSSEAQVERLVSETLTRFQKIDILVNNAGRMGTDARGEFARRVLMHESSFADDDGAA